MKLRLNISPCPNDTFMFDALVNGRIDTQGLQFDVSFADIEQLNAGVLAGDTDISKISYAVFPRIRQRYRILDSGSALGTGNGPLLVGRRHLDMTAGKYRIAVPGENTTANRLMEILFPDQTHRTPVLFSEIANRVLSGEFDAGVLIHEGRFTYREKGLELIADLGTEWERLTAMPLPLGAIVAGNHIPYEVGELVGNLLGRSIRYAMENPDISRNFVKRHAQEMDDDVIDRHIELFVNSYSVSLGAEGRKAVEKFTGLGPQQLFL